MKTKIWDLKPDGGGNPLLVEMESVDAREAIERHPERYSDVAPEGTVEHDLAEKKRARATALADVTREENEALSKLHADRREKIEAIRKEEREARAAEEERIRAEQAEAEGKLKLQNRQGDIDQVEQQAKQEEARVRAEFAEKRKAALATEPPAPEPVIVPEPTPIPPAPKPVKQKSEDAGDQS